MDQRNLLTPSPLVGDGRGEGLWASAAVLDPSPQPSPTRGEGAGKTALVEVYDSVNGIGACPAGTIPMAGQALLYGN